MENKRIYFLTVFEDKDGGFWGSFPDFECCVDQGDTLEKMVNNATAVLETTVEYMVEKGEKLPEPSNAAGIKAKADPDDGDIAFVVPVSVYPPAKTERINITAPGDKIARINDYAKAHHLSRSQLMIDASINYIHAHR